MVLLFGGALHRPSAVQIEAEMAGRCCDFINALFVWALVPWSIGKQRLLHI